MREYLIRLWFCPSGAWLAGNVMGAQLPYAFPRRTAVTIVRRTSISSRQALSCINSTRLTWLRSRRTVRDPPLAQIAGYCCVSPYRRGLILRESAARYPTAWRPGRRLRKIWRLAGTYDHCFAWLGRPVFAALGRPPVGRYHASRPNTCLLTAPSAAPISPRVHSEMMEWVRPPKHAMLTTPQRQSRAGQCCAFFAEATGARFFCKILSQSAPKKCSRFRTARRLESRPVWPRNSAKLVPRDNICCARSADAYWQESSGGLISSSSTEPGRTGFG